MGILFLIVMVLGYLIDAVQSYLSSDISPAIAAAIPPLQDFLSTVGQTPWIIGLIAVLSLASFAKAGWDRINKK